MQEDRVKLAALTRLFSSAVIRELATKGRSALYTRLVKQSGAVADCGKSATVGDCFDLAFDKLKIAGQRDEYVYRAALTHKILMGTHSLQSASMLNEFRAGACKADTVILNGTATVYEIKSERDSLARLSNQIFNYKQVFAKVNVIASEDHVESVLESVPDDVGVLCLSRRYRISTEQEGRNCPERISPIAVFESLRASEAISILQSLGVHVPKVTNIQRHAVLRDLFRELDPASLHVEMVKTLKRTRSLRSLSELVDRLPDSLKPAALSTPLRKTDHLRLVDAVETPLRSALRWS